MKRSTLFALIFLSSCSTQPPVKQPNSLPPTKEQPALPIPIARLSFAIPSNTNRFTNPPTYISNLTIQFDLVKPYTNGLVFIRSNILQSSTDMLDWRTIKYDVWSSNHVKMSVTNVTFSNEVKRFYRAGYLIQTN